MKNFWVWFLIYISGVISALSFVFFPLGLGLIAFVGFCALLSGVVYYLLS